MNSLLTNQFLLLDLASPVFIQITVPLIRFAWHTFFYVCVLFIGDGVFACLFVLRQNFKHCRLASHLLCSQERYL